MILVDWTLIWTMRSIAVMRSRGFSNQPLGVVRDTAFLVCCDFIAVDKPFQGRSTVDDVSVRCCWDAGYTDMLV